SDTPSISAPDRSANPAWSSALSSNLLRVAGIPLPSSPSLQAVKAYVLPNYSYRETTAGLDLVSGASSIDISSDYLSGSEQHKSAPSTSEIALKSVYHEGVLASSDPVRGDIAHAGANLPDSPSHRESVTGTADSADIRSETIDEARRSTSNPDNQSLAVTIPRPAPLVAANTSLSQNSRSRIALEGRDAPSSASPSVSPAFSQQEQPHSPVRTESIVFGSKVQNTFPAQSGSPTTPALASPKSLVSSIEGERPTAGVPAGSTESVQQSRVSQLDRPDVLAATSGGYVSNKTATPKDAPRSAISTISEKTYPKTSTSFANPGDRSTLFITSPATTTTSTTGSVDHVTSSPYLSP